MPLRFWRVNCHSKGSGDLFVAAAEAEEMLFEALEVSEALLTTIRPVKER
jgi:hypothetical protein